jgi:hypothetical protein
MVSDSVQTPLSQKTYIKHILLFGIIIFPEWKIIMPKENQI